MKGDESMQRFETRVDIIGAVLNSETAKQRNETPKQRNKTQKYPNKTKTHCFE